MQASDDVSACGDPARPAVAHDVPIRLPTHEQVRGFDFLHGAWRVTHRKLRERLADCVEWIEFPGTLDVGPILGGCGNLDDNELFDPAGGYQANSLRLFHPARNEWSIWWLSSRDPVLESPVVGGFSGPKGTFFGSEILDGRPVLVRTTYEPLSLDRAEWTQAFSPDDGASWEVNWIMSFERSSQ